MFQAQTEGGPVWGSNKRGKDTMLMKTVVIDSLERISVLGNAGSSPELTAIGGDDPTKSVAALNTLEQLVTSLPLDDEVSGNLLDLGSDIFSQGSEDGFRRGFRLAVHLMTECQEGADTRGKDER